MNSDENKIYMKILTFDEIYSFVLQTFLFEVILRSEKMIYWKFWFLARTRHTHTGRGVHAPATPPGKALSRRAASSSEHGHVLFVTIRY
jgi:hypothetical protein